MALNVGMARNHSANKSGVRKTCCIQSPLTTKVTSRFGVRTSDHLGDRSLIHLTSVGKMGKSN